MKVKFVQTFVLIVIIGFLGLLVNGLDGKATAQVGDEAIDFEIKDMDGQLHRLEDYRGKTVVINFFATWCQPCIDEAPELEAFGTEYDDAELLIIARGESKKRMEKYINGIDSKLLYLLDTNEKVSKDYGVIGQPETMIINPDGTIVERFSGPTTKQHLIQLIEEKVSS